MDSSLNREKRCLASGVLHVVGSSRFILSSDAICVRAVAHRYVRGVSMSFPNGLGIVEEGGGGGGMVVGVVG